MGYFWLKLIHILSSTILFGTGLGSAFYMYRANKTNNVAAMLFAAQNVVIADWVFTLPSVIIQPLTGIALIHVMRLNWDTPWLIASYALYVLAGICWIPVVAIQIKMRDMLSLAIEQQNSLPKRYYHYFKIWYLLGWPAFIAVVVIFYLMIFKPL